MPTCSFGVAERLDHRHPRPRSARLPFFDRRGLDFGARLGLALRFGFATALGWRRSGNSALPAARFHSSKVSGEISPLTSSSANFLRCALLLIGIGFPSSNDPAHQPVRWLRRPRVDLRLERPLVFVENHDVVDRLAFHGIDAPQ